MEDTLEASLEVTVTMVHPPVEVMAVVTPRLEAMEATEGLQVEVMEDNLVEDMEDPLEEVTTLEVTVQLEDRDRDKEEMGEITCIHEDFKFLIWA